MRHGILWKLGGVLVSQFLPVSVVFRFASDGFGLDKNTSHMTGGLPVETKDQWRCQEPI